MYINNPYAVWNNTAINHPNRGTSSAPAVSIFGALPYIPTPIPSNLIPFHFTSSNSTVLNSMVVGPRSCTYFHVATDSNMSGYSTFTNSEGKKIALIEWQAQPQVEVRGTVSKQHVRRWLALSPDQSFRIMNAGGHKYIWAPHNGCICLYTSGTSNPELIAKISRGQGIVTLEMTANAIQAGLLESAVVAAVLLQCGRSID